MYPYNPLITIVIPVYNGSNYLKDCIKARYNKVIIT